MEKYGVGDVAHEECGNDKEGNDGNESVATDRRRCVGRRNAEGRRPGMEN